MKLATLISIPIMALCNHANSSPVNYERKDIISAAVESGTIDTSGITDIFSMNVNFRKVCLGVPINLNCNWSFSTRLYDDGAHLKMEITDFTSGGGGLCASINGGASPQPWLGAISHTDLPLSGLDFHTLSPMLISNVFIQTSCGSCEGDLQATYFPSSEGGYIGMSGTLPNSPSIPTGNCSFNGILKSENYDYSIWH